MTRLGDTGFFQACEVFQKLSIVFFIFLAVGCGSTSLTVTGIYPQPLTTALPLTATVLLDEKFRTYIAKPNKDITMSMGVAQTQMLETVLGQRFQSVTVVSVMPETLDSDVLIVVGVDGVQVGTPKQTHKGIYEVWIKYFLEISNSSKELIAKWFMPAYGKTPSAFMTSSERAIDTAAQVALRDAGVRLITDLHRIPELHYWIKQNKDIGTPEPAAKQNVEEMPDQETQEPGDV